MSHGLSAVAPRRLALAFALLASGVGDRPIAAQLAPGSPHPGSPHPGSPQLPALPGNLLIVIADDLGVEELTCYGVGNDFPSTPTIDALAAGGLRFDNCWSNPMCSPTRATIQTGRYGLRTGVGFLVTNVNLPLVLSEVTLPEMLDLGAQEPWSNALIGKWHLGNATQGGVHHPNLQGWSHFSGTAGNISTPWSYYFWPHTVNGTTTVSTNYATTQQVDDALAWVATAEEPWLLVISFNAPHLPFHAPPPALHSQDLTGLLVSTSPRPFYKAAVEAMDTELGRFYSSMDPVLRKRTNTIFVADNGTPAAVVPPEFDPAHAKLSMYQGGVQVPLIVHGPAVEQPGRIASDLVHTVDLWATVAEFADVTPSSVLPPGTVLDSISLVPQIQAAPYAHAGRTLYTDRFQPNGFGPFTTDARAVRDERWKLITDSQAPTDELYDLQQDPQETNNLAPAFHAPGSAAAYSKLRRALDRLLP